MGKRILLVEGPDDQHVMWNLFEVRAIPETFKVECPKEQDPEDSDRQQTVGGDAILLGSLRTWLKEADLECLAVIVDANGKGPQARWQSIRDRLTHAGYTGIPIEHSERGTIVELSLRPRTPRSIRFGAWIMPDNRSEGMLEDFVASLIRDQDSMLPLVDGFLDSIPADQRRFSPAHQPKARIHAWLAVSERPGRPMGQAIKADKYINVHDPSVQPFLDWIGDALLK